MPAHLERFGLSVPATWDAYFATAEELVRKSGGAVRGFGQRGKEAWHTMYTGYASQIWSCGGRDFDDDLRCAIASPEVVEPTEALHRRAAGRRPAVVDGAALVRARARLRRRATTA